MISIHNQMNDCIEYTQKHFSLLYCNELKNQIIDFEKIHEQVEVLQKKIYSFFIKEIRTNIEHYNFPRLDYYKRIYNLNFKIECFNDIFNHTKNIPFCKSDNFIENIFCFKNSILDRDTLNILLYSNLFYDRYYNNIIIPLTSIIEPKFSLISDEYEKMFSFGFELFHELTHVLIADYNDKKINALSYYKNNIDWMDVKENSEKTLEEVVCDIIALEMLTNYYIKNNHNTKSSINTLIQYVCDQSGLYANIHSGHLSGTLRAKILMQNIISDTIKEKN